MAAARPARWNLRLETLFHPHPRAGRRDQAHPASGPGTGRGRGVVRRCARDTGPRSSRDARGSGGSADFQGPLAARAARRDGASGNEARGSARVRGGMGRQPRALAVALHPGQNPARRSRRLRPLAGQGAGEARRRAALVEGTGRESGRGSAFTARRPRRARRRHRGGGGRVLEHAGGAGTFSPRVAAHRRALPPRARRHLGFRPAERAR